MHAQNDLTLWEMQAFPGFCPPDAQRPVCPLQVLPQPVTSRVSPLRERALPSPCGSQAQGLRLSCPEQEMEEDKNRAASSGQRH